MTEFKITVDDREVKKLLGQLQKKVTDMTPVMQEIGEIVRTSVIKNFEAGGRYSEEGSWRGGSKTWRPLSVATLFAERKSKFVTKGGRYKKGVEERFKNRRILIGPGSGGTRLMDSIKSKAAKDRVEIGTNVVYAAIHQFGGPAGRGLKVRIPARPFMVIQDEDLSQIKRAILRHLEINEQ